MKNSTFWLLLGGTETLFAIFAFGSNKVEATTWISLLAIIPFCLVSFFLARRREKHILAARKQFIETFVYPAREVSEQEKAKATLNLIAQMERDQV